MAHPLWLFNQGGYTSLFIASIFLTQMLVNSCPLLYALEIRVVYGFGIRLRRMCEVTPYMEATTASWGISVIYHTLQCCISYIPRHGTLIFTSSVVHNRLTCRLYVVLLPQTRVLFYTQAQGLHKWYVLHCLCRLISCCGWPITSQYYN